MTTPTQAQIAAAQIITDQDREYARDCLNDLKAEADLDDVETIAQWFRKVRHEYALTAAAAVGEGRTWGQKDFDDYIAEVKADTIERCAQVADSFRWENRGFPSGSIADEIAVAIRALMASK